MVVKIPKATIKRIAKETIPDIRIGEKALARLQDVATDFIRVVILDCDKVANHTKRKTILESDVIFATE